MRKAFWRRGDRDRNFDPGNIAPLPALKGSRIGARLLALTLIVLLLAFGLGSGLNSLRRASAQEDVSGGANLPETPNALVTPAADSSGSLEVPAQANAAVDQDPCTGGTDNLPKPTPMPGAVRVVQLVNCTNQILLGAANAPFRAPGTPVPVVPRENTWVMQPLGAANNQNIITIDVPPGWADTGPVHSTGPNIWARTGCRFDPTVNRAQCETGGCGADLYNCSAPGVGVSGFTTFTEWNFFQPIPPTGPIMFHKENFDVSAVNGASLNVDVQPVGGDAMDPGAVGDDQWINYAYPLTVHGDDPRNANHCPANFQLNRSSITPAKTGGIFGYVLLDNNGQPSGGDNTIACLNNCGFYKFPAEPLFNCDRTQPRCLYWNTFCAPNPTGTDYGQPCNTDADCAKFGLNAACWIQHPNIVPSPTPVGVDHTCQLRAFYANAPAACPTTVCTFPYGYTNSLTGMQVFSTQPPAGLCSQVAINGDNPSQICVGDDTIHQVLNKVYTWPNDPQVYGGDAPLYRIVFAPGQGNAPITPAGPIPLCSALPAIYGYSNQYHGPNACTPGQPCSNCDISVNQQGAIFAVAQPSPLNWGCNLPANGAGDNGVICRWNATEPTATPSGTPTPTPSPTLGPTGSPTSTPTGAATVFSGNNVVLKGKAGSFVTATFKANNNTAAAEQISSITITLTNSKIFSALALSGGGQVGSENPMPPTQGTGNPSPPELVNVFTFSPPIPLASGASTTFTLTATIGSNTASISPSILADGIAYAADGPSSGAPRSSTRTPWMVLTILMLMAGVAMASVSPGRRLTIALGAIVLAVAIGGCGGSGSSGAPSPGPSSGVSVVTAETLGPYMGLPLSIATVQRVK
jgi:hypothetical protein